MKQLELVAKHKVNGMFGGIPVSDVVSGLQQGKPDDLCFYKHGGSQFTIEEGQIVPEYEVVVFVGFKGGSRTVPNKALTDALKNEVPQHYEVVYIDYDDAEGYYNTTRVETGDGKVFLTGEYLQ